MSQVKILILAAGAALVSAEARGDVVFHAWVEAPASVERGSTFTVSVWLEIQGSVLLEGEGAVYGHTVDVLASGIGASFAPASLHTPGTSLGTPEPNALRGVVGFNHPAISPFSVANPLELFTTEVTLEPGATGTLELDLAQTQGWDFMFSWWVDYHLGTYVFDTDIGSTRMVTPAVVQVIPSPASVGMVGLAALGLARRRR